MFKIYNKKFFKYFIYDKRTFFKYFSLSFIVGVLELTGVALTFPFIIGLLNKESIDSTSILYGCLIILAFLAKNIFMIFYTGLQADFTKNYEANIKKQFMHYFLFANYNTVSKIAFHKKNQILGFLSSSAINNYLIRILNINVNVFIFSLLLTFLFIKFFFATTIALISTLVLLYTESIYFKNKTTKIAKEMNKANEELNLANSEPLLNIKTIKIHNGEKHFFNRFCKKLDDLNGIAKDIFFFNSIPPYVTEPFIIVILMILLAIISFENKSNTDTLVASYAVIVSVIFRLAPTINRIQVNLTGINTALPQVNELIDYYEEFDLNNFKPQETPSTRIEESITLKNICFSYEEKNILDNVNIEIKKGDFIGIAGSSGAGKTTLIDIIAGLLEIKSGEIYIDNKLVSSSNMPHLKIGYIPQEYSLISGSIRENIAFGAKEINDEKVIKVLKQAQLYDYIISNYADGIYAKPFVDSIGFSQGQKQRLAIARALYTDPDILILDEATASLDLNTELEICDTLNQLKGNKTIIAIAHRISTIKNADKIFLMQNSTVVASGSFQELLDKNEDFKKLVELNNANFIH